MVLGLLSRLLMCLRLLTPTSEMCYLRSTGSTLDKPHLGQLCSKFSGSGRGMTYGKVLLSHPRAGMGTPVMPSGLE